MGKAGQGSPGDDAADQSIADTAHNGRAIATERKPALNADAPRTAAKSHAPGTIRLGRPVSRYT